jgi:hypothetical protein
LDDTTDHGPTANPSQISGKNKRKLEQIFEINPKKQENATKTP